jgi:hypothetical protein
MELCRQHCNHRRNLRSCEMTAWAQRSPQPKRRKMPGLTPLVILPAYLRKRRESYSVAVGPHSVLSLWMIGRGICSIESFFRRKQSARRKSLRTPQMEEPVEGMRRVSWKAERRRGHSSFNLLILMDLILGLPFPCWDSRLQVRFRRGSLGGPGHWRRGLRLPRKRSGWC